MLPVLNQCAAGDILFKTVKDEQQQHIWQKDRESE